MRPQKPRGRQGARQVGPQGRACSAVPRPPFWRAKQSGGQKPLPPIWKNWGTRPGATSGQK